MMERATPYILGLLLVASAGFAGLFFQQHPVTLADLPFIPACSSPLTYRVGTIDERFGMTKEEIAKKLEEAASLWNTAAGKPVLAYAPDDSHAIPVNFVYDQRQQTVSLGKQIDATEASQNAAREELNAAQAAYVRSQQAYADAVDSFNAKSQAYAQEVARTNKNGGAGPDEYARLTAEKAALKEEQRRLEAQGETLDAEGKNLKAKIAAYNANVRDINQTVDAFNSTLGGDFEEGQYVRESNGAKHIEIYAYRNPAELIHSLSHEFGHALGLPHNDNTESIMFPYNKSSVSLSEDDLAALKVACKL